MKRIIRLTESDLTRIVRRVLNEDVESYEIVQLKKEDIKSISFLDGSGKDIIKDYTIQSPDRTGGDIKVNLNAVNFVDEEVCNFRLWLSKDIKVNTASPNKNATFMIADNSPKKLDRSSFNIIPKKEDGTVISVKFPINFVAGDVTSFQIRIPTLNTQYGEITISIVPNKQSWQVNKR